MAFPQILWILASHMSIFMAFLMFAWTVYYNIRGTDIPADITQRVKLRCCNLIIGYFAGLGRFLEKVGICHRYKLWRLLINGIPPMNDSCLIIKDLNFNEVPVRVYCLKTSPVVNRRGVVYLHGGIGLFGGFQAYERKSRFISRESDSVVVTVGFRLAPEHPYPVPVLDCCTATIHFLKNAKEYGVDPDRIIVCGDSSGGTFATIVCQELASRADLPRLRAQILLYPFLQAVDFSLPSYQQNHSVPILSKKRAVKHGFFYLVGRYLDRDKVMKSAHVPVDLWVKYRKWISADLIPEEFKVRGYKPLVPDPFSKKLHEICKQAFEPICSPLLAEDTVIRQLPEMFLLTCEYDILRDDGLLYKKRLEDNGVRVTWHHVKDGFHGISFAIDYGILEFSRARDILLHVVAFLKDL